MYKQPAPGRLSGWGNWGSVRREQGAKGMGTQLTLFHVEHIHCPEELGLTVQTALPQASQAVQVVVQGHKAGEGPFTGNVGELGPGPRLYIKDLEGIDCVLRLSSPWRWGGGTGYRVEDGLKKKKAVPENRRTGFALLLSSHLKDPSRARAVRLSPRAKEILRLLASIFRGLMQGSKKRT